MVTLREVMYDAELGTLARVGRSVLLATTLITIYCMGTFLVSAQDSLQSGLRIDAEREFVSITDSLADPSDFYDYSSQSEGVERVGKFYNALSEDLTGGTFLTVFNQRISVANDSPLRAFAAGPDGEAGRADDYFHPFMNTEVYDIRSVQLNRNAWEFYGLGLSDNAVGIDWDSVDYMGPGPHPLVLGSKYRSIYDIGDSIRVGFYNIVVDFKVQGFLDERSMLFLKGDFNYPLDEVMVIPYPVSVEPMKISEDGPLDFYRILVFAMISGDIALRGDQDFDTIANEVALLAQQSGFNEYAFLGASEYLTQFRLVRNLVLSNKSLVIYTVSAVAVIALFLATGVSLYAARLRSARDRSLWAVGVSTNEIVQLRIRSNALYWLLSGLIFVTGLRFLPGQDSKSLLVVAALAAGYCVYESFIEKSVVDRLVLE